jgi:hypothetical protein
MAEILRHRRETRRQTDKANVCLNVGKDPAYFPTTVRVRLAKNERSRKRILMPRHARIVAAGFPLHAILRGIDRSAIFFDDADDRALLGMLVERAAAESVWVHA